MTCVSRLARGATRLAGLRFVAGSVSEACPACSGFGSSPGSGFFLGRGRLGTAGSVLGLQQCFELAFAMHAGEADGAFIFFAVAAIGERHAPAGWDRCRARS